MFPFPSLLVPPPSHSLSASSTIASQPPTTLVLVKFYYILNFSHLSRKERENHSPFMHTYIHRCAKLEKGGEKNWNLIFSLVKKRERETFPSFFISLTFEIDKISTLFWWHEKTNSFRSFMKRCEIQFDKMRKEGNSGEY